MKSERNLKTEVNYIFWIAILVALTYSNFQFLSLIKEANWIEQISISVSFSAFALFEIFLFILSLHFLKAYSKSNKILCYISYGFVFLFTVSYYADHHLFVLQGYHTYDGLRFLFGEGFDRSLSIAKSSGIRNVKFATFIVVTLLLPFVGMVVYKVFDKISRLKPLHLSIKQLVVFCFIFAGIYFSEQAISSETKRRRIWYQQNYDYPLHISIFKPNPGILTYNIKMKQFRSKKTIESELKKLKSQNLKRPHIFFLVIDSLREDIITPKIAPNLYKLKQESLKLSETISNANCTHYSWFSIMNSNYPYAWNHSRREKNKKGSVPIRILKKIGYKIFSFSSPELDYFDYNQVIFGNNNKLTDHYIDHYDVEASMSSLDLGRRPFPEKDRELFKRIKSFMDKQDDKKPSFYFINLEGPHHNYYWPKDFKLKFKPIAKDLNYGKTKYTKKDLEKLKNRYKNSVYFTDSQVGAFIQYLKDKELYDRSIITITGDHGEEFFEHGHFSHSSTLYKEQVNVALIMKFPKQQMKIKKGPVAPINILPTILDYIGIQLNYNNLFDGQSLVRKKRLYSLSSKWNGRNDPVEYMIHTGEYKLFFLLDIENENEQKIHITEIQDGNDKKIYLDDDKKALRTLLKKEFDDIFEDLKKTMFEIQNEDTT